MRGMVLLFAAAIAGLTLVPANDHGPQAVGETFREPPVVASRAGVLRITLTAAPSTVSVAGHRAVLMVYNGQYVPPTLHVRPGDTMRVRLVNAIDQPTSLHTHGLTVSPRGNSDNVFWTSPPDGHRITAAPSASRPPSRPAGISTVASSSTAEPGSTCRSATACRERSSLTDCWILSRRFAVCGSA